MTFNPEKPCTTRDEDVVVILSTEMWGKKSIAAMIGKGDRQKLYRYFGNGQYFIGRKSRRDLINIPNELFVNIYDVDHLHAEFHYSRDSADECATDQRIACLPFTKGQGLDGETQ